MKKHLLPIALLISIISYAQVGIGTPIPDNSAQLEVQSANKGVLVPRIALTSTTDITTIPTGNVDSLVLFNIATIADITPGYYYWFNSKWNRIQNQDDIALLDTDDQTLSISGTILTIQDGNSVDLAPAVSIAETLTSLIDNSDGTLTYNDEDGNPNVINLSAAVTTLETLTSLIDNGDGTLTYNDEDGTVNIVNLSAAVAALETLTTLIDNGDGTLTYTDEDGVITTINLATAVSVLETTTNLIQNNGTGEITYTNEDGIVQTANVISTDASNAITVGSDGGAYITPATGDTSEVIQSVGHTDTEVTGGTANTIATHDPDGAGVLPSVAINETVTTVANTIAGHKIGDYTNESGVAIDVNETITNLAQAATGQITYTNEDGVAQTADVISIDPGNLVVAGSDGGAFMNQGTIQDNETTTNLIQNNSTGEITYTNEDGIVQTANVISTDASNAITVGSDGGAYITPATGDTSEVIQSVGHTDTEVTGGTANTIATHDPDGAGVLPSVAINETVTTVANTIAGHKIGDYTNESGAAIDVNETITNLAQAATGEITYTNEDGVAQTADVVSSDAGNLAVAGSDGGAFVNVAGLTGDGTLTTTSTAITIGGTPVNSLLEDVSIDVTTVSVDAGNLITAGADGGSFMDQGVIQANETTTNLIQNNGTGEITYTNEDGVVQTANVISTDASNAITVGSDGGAYITPATGDTSEVIQSVGHTDTEVTGGTANTIATHDPDGAGVLPSVAINETVTTVANTIAGHKITDYTNENGTITDVNETITSIGLAGSVITYNDEDGAATNIDITDAETTTDMVQNDTTGVISYTNEDGVVQTADVVSADAGNLAVAGSDGGAFVNVAGLTGDGTLTTTSTAITIGGTPVNSLLEDVSIDVTTVSVDAGNLITAGADGGSFVNAAGLAGDGTLTTTSTAVTIGGTPVNSLLEDISIDVTTVSADAGNLITAGADGGSFMDAAALAGAETTTNLTQDGTGVITYTNEDGVAQTADVISTDIGNIVTVGSDGGAYVDPNAINTSELTQAVGNTDAEVTGGTANTIAVHDPDGAGVLSAVTINETLTAVRNPLAGHKITDYTNENGTITDINETITSIGLAGSIITYTDEDGAATNIDITDAETTTSIANTITGHKIADYTNEDGIVQDINETITNIGLAGSVITYNDEDGAATNIDITDAETTTDMVQNDATGVISYTNEDGVVQTADILSTDSGNLITVGADGGTFMDQGVIQTNETTTNIANTVTGHKIADYTNEDGIVQDINETVTTISQNNTTGVISYVDENGATDSTVNGGELLNVVSADANNAISIGGDGGAYIDGSVITPFQVAFSAEYDGATLFADGTDNTGTMTSDNAGPTNNWMNYYEWLSAEISLQDNDVIFRFTLPSDFVSWQANAIEIDYQTNNAAIAENAFSAAVYLETSGTTAITTIAQTASTTWTTATIANTAVVTIGANNAAVIVLKMESRNSNAVKIGDITLNYNK